MSQSGRVMGMILVFFLLTSVETPIASAVQVSKIDWKMTPASLTPPWQPFAPGVSEPPGEVEGMKAAVELTRPIEPELLRAVLEAQSCESGDEYVRVIVYLREQTDLGMAAGEALSVVETRSRIVSVLQADAARVQAPLQAYLEGAQAAGLVDSYTPFWIFNGMAIRARASFVQALAAHPSVAVVRLDHYRQWITDEPQNLPISNQEIFDSPEWGIARVRADQVWASLHVSGTGAVVAGMDTGVDWLHPALQANYRGYNPHGPSNHTYSWHDAIGDGALYPVDSYGHGSHTLGTAVGQGGIGVAPGAQWIAVRVLNSQGSGYDSWIHEGFQWLMAPGGDPGKAPDVVNCSWGSNNGSLIVFQPDLQALRAAGIFAVFANGNNGPDGGTVGSPASLPEAFAVGATDADDDVANFSSRGPSPWGEVRPHVAAPGVDVRSSLPGGAYSLANGTSMAAPHVAGIAALLRSLSPTLSITRTAFLITSTAVPSTSSVPNNDAGWGRVDAFAAVVALGHPGFISGTVTRVGSDTPIANASVVAAHHAGEGGGRATTDSDGSYLLALAPAPYDVTVSTFGYEPATIWGVVATTDTTTIVDFSLTPLPTGVLQGHVTDASSGAPVTATITVLDTPLATMDDAYNFALPAGAYTVRARALGYQVVTNTMHIAAGQTIVADLSLAPAPSVLLVDSGSWYYDSQIDYFRQALDDLRYAYDEWPIKHLPDDIPAASDLAFYDVVVWSAPLDSPGFIGAGDVIAGYLSAGGRLILSGQDVGYWDDERYGSIYYRDYLKAYYISDDAPTRVLRGLGNDLFAGLTMTITGAGGADNQVYPDEIAVADPDAADPLLVYDEGECGGLRVGTCLDYRVVYLSFGFEAINERAIREEVMERAVDWLVSPLPVFGVELDPTSQMRIGLPGSLVTHTLRVRHVGQGGVTDTVNLSIAGASWETQLSQLSLDLTPCASATVVVTVTIPPTVGWDMQDEITITARSFLSATLVQTAALTTKAPAPILLVDDDRWYDQEAKYETALTGAGLPYDYWRTGWSGRNPPWGSPPLETLQRYPILVWFTGYDWYKPVTEDEKAMLATYLDGGGRLFLSSQDFLYYHSEDPFSLDYLGVAGHTEDVTPTVALGAPEDPIGDRLGPYPLSYPFQNWSDAVTPAPDVAVPFRESERRPIALARRAEEYRTVFFSFPFETLPEPGRAEVMERIVGWLSWLGGSTFTAGRGAIVPGDALTYTLRVQNDGPDAITASLSNTLPADLIIVPDSVIGPGSYNPSARRLFWTGLLDPGQTMTFSYRAAVVTGTALSSPIVNTARFGVEDHQIRFHRAAVVRVGASDLSGSTFRCVPSPARPNGIVTCTVNLVNAGPGDAAQATAISLLPEDTTLVPGSATWTGVGTVETPTGTVHWAGPVSAGAQVSLTYQIALSTPPIHPPLYSVAFLEDGVGGAWERPTWMPLDPWRAYLPLVFRKSSQ